MIETLAGGADRNGVVVHKTPDDPRVTRVGRFIRRTSLDMSRRLQTRWLASMSCLGGAAARAAVAGGEL